MVHRFVGSLNHFAYIRVEVENYYRFGICTESKIKKWLKKKVVNLRSGMQHGNNNTESRVKSEKKNKTEKNAPVR